MHLSFIKAITICQPYAELIARGDKRVENRSWRENYRGPIAIHAGKSRAWLDTYAPLPAAMDYGAIVAIAQLVAIVHIRALDRWLAQPGHEARFGWLRAHAHFSGPYGWVLEDVRRVGPIPSRGLQGLWSWRVPWEHAAEVSAAIAHVERELTR